MKHLQERAQRAHYRTCYMQCTRDIAQTGAPAGFFIGNHIENRKSKIENFRFSM
jgi:hypothetical protein